MSERARPVTVASPDVPPELLPSGSALALEYQDMLRQEVRAERKSLVVGAAALTMAAGALVGLVLVIGASTRWGWWALLPGGLLLLPGLMCVVALVQMLDQAAPVTEALRFTTQDHVGDLDEMTTGAWLRFRLNWAGPQVGKKLRRLRGAVDIVAGSVALALAAGLMVLLFELIGLGR